MIDRYELASGATCSIAVEWGCNAYSWIVDGRELMYCPPELPAQATKVTGGGSPLLFPAIGRTWDLSVDPPVPGNYRIYGSDKTYFMPSHGIVYLSRFERVELDEGTDRISALYQLNTPQKVHEENYPFDVSYQQRFTLCDSSIEFETILINQGSTPAPVAFGHHPYFRISNAEREGVELHLPVTKWLKTNPDTVLFNGDSEPAGSVLKFEPDIYYDHVFAGVNGSRMSLIDAGAGSTIHVDFDEKFELLTVYAPDGADFVCIEPWSRGLGAFCYLDKPGWESGDIAPVILPGQTRTMRVKYGVEL
jgi:galactose mutarotase-like enzyme